MQHHDNEIVCMRKLVFEFIQDYKELLFFLTYCKVYEAILFNDISLFQVSVKTEYLV